MIVALVGYEYGAARPLMPVRRLATTLPVSGVLVARGAGASSASPTTSVAALRQPIRKSPPRSKWGKDYAWIR